MTMKKIASPIIKYITNGNLAIIQYGAKERSDYGIAKLILNYMSMKNGFRKLLLIHATAAFDKVRRKTLRQIIADWLDNNATIILSFMDIETEFIMDIMSEKVNPTQNIFQGVFYSSFLFAYT